MRSRQGRNLGIQALRALAALLVVVDHGLYTLVDKAGGDAGTLPLAEFLGGTGVEIFFLVSGFVMVVSASASFGPAASADFLRRRLVRVVPLYWLTTLVYAAKLRMTGELPVPMDVLRSLFFLPHANAHGELMPVYGLGWTLNYEMLFYAVFAIGLLGSMRTTLAFTALAIGGLVAFGAGLPDAGTGRGSVMLYFWSRPIMLFFLAGMAIAWLARHRPVRGGAAGLTGLLAVAAVVACHRFELPFAVRLAALAALVWVAASNTFEASTHPLARAAAALGDASYSIYLTHSFVIGPLARVYARAGVESTAGYLALSLVLSAVVGLLAYRYVERPLLRRLSTPRPRAATAHAAA